MKIFKRIILVILLMFLSISLLIIGNGYSMYKTSIEVSPLEEKIAQIRNKENYTSLSVIPKMYQNAVVSVEDHRFFNHPGIDIIAIGRAVVNDIKAMSLVEGGSTITQQLAKNIYFTQEKKFTRKIAEIFMSFEIEKHYSKNDILELYINTCYFGNGYYSIKDASLGYFNKEPQNMSDAESILLAGIPNAPSIYSPYENFSLSKQRQKQVLASMVKNEYLTEEEANKISNDNSTFLHFK